MDEKVYLDKDGLDYLLSKLPQPSNPNLLINPDFKINQRGKDAYPGTKLEYTVDRWCPLTANMTYIEVLDNGIKGHTLTANGAAQLIQYIEYPEKYNGKTLTLTVSCVKKTEKAVVTIGILYKTNGDDTWKTGVLDRTIKEGVSSVTAKLPENLSVLMARIDFGDTRVSGTVNDYAIISWAKLEIGDKATPFVPPDPAMELLKCQRYYIPLEVGTYSRLSVSNPNNVAVALQLPAKMRISKPTITGTFGVSPLMNDPSNVHTGFTVASVSHIKTSGILLLNLSKTAHGLTDGSLYVVEEGALDAEIY